SGVTSAVIADINVFGEKPSVNITSVRKNPLKGYDLNVTWRNVGEPHANDWLGLFTPGAPDDAPSDYWLVSCSKNVSQAKESGSCALWTSVALTVPYEIRLLTSTDQMPLIRQALVASPTFRPPGVGTAQPQLPGVASPQLTVSDPVAAGGSS